MRERFIYDREMFTVPVTKAEPLRDIQFIIDDFIEKKITFCVDGAGQSWQLWRKVEDGDSEKIKKKGSPAQPLHLYVDGEKIEKYILP